MLPLHYDRSTPPRTRTWNRPGFDSGSFTILHSGAKAEGQGIEPWRLLHPAVFKTVSSSMPVTFREYLGPDSNREHHGPKPCASANWATQANWCAYGDSNPGPLA